MTIGEDFTTMTEETTIVAAIDMATMQEEAGAGGTVGVADGAMTMGETTLESRRVHRSNQQHWQNWSVMSRAVTKHH